VSAGLQWSSGAVFENAYFMLLSDLEKKLTDMSESRKKLLAK